MRRSLAFSLAALMFIAAGCKGDPKTPEYWDKALKGAKKQKDRERTVSALRESGHLSPAFLPMLHEHLAAEKKAEVRTGIVRVLGELKDPSSVQPLIDALDLGAADSASHATNKEIANTLAAIGDAKATPHLLKLLRSRDAYTKIEAINALGALKAKEAVEPLTEIATSETGEPFLSKKAIQALGEIGQAESVPALVRMMFKERRGVSFYVESSFALYQIGKPSTDALLPIITGKDQQTMAWAKKNNIILPAVYAKAAQVLGDLQDERAEEALLSKLKFDDAFLDVKLFVRMRAADALGRLRSAGAAKTLASMLDEEEANARAEYIRALVKIGGRDGIPALTKAASNGSWDAREPAIIGLSMLGDEREVALMEKLATDEEALTRAECKEYPDYAGCSAPEELVKKHVAAIQTHGKRIEAAKACKEDFACWAKKLDDADAGVKERAAFELGRSKKAEFAETLTGHLTEPNLDARLAVIQALDWLTEDSADALKRAQSARAALLKQIAAEKGKTQFVKVNEDLRRLAVKLNRT